MRDRYDNLLTTDAEAARNHYVMGLDLLLAAQPGAEDAFQASVEADEGFALGYCGKARALQFAGKMPAAKEAMNAARALAAPLSTREQSHIRALGLLIDGQSAEAHDAIRAHVDLYPRDALLAQTCSSVFGLIGFSGQAGREPETLAYMAALMPHYGEDWWALSQYAFALCENGALDRADKVIERALALKPDNANGAHVRSHVYYEAGQPQAGTRYLNTWLESYDRRGALHGHLSWHSALWALEDGDSDAMWARLASDIGPEAAFSPAINVVTDTASLYYRAELSGENVPRARWEEISQYAAAAFPGAAVGFIEIHAALAHAMAGDGAALRRLIETPNGVTGDLVAPVAEAFEAMAQSDWQRTVDTLSRAMADHARLGGSRAQRDLLEYTLFNALMRLGRGEEARRVITLRRPALAATRMVSAYRAG